LKHYTILECQFGSLSCILTMIFAAMATVWYYFNLKQIFLISIPLCLRLSIWYHSRCLITSWIKVI